MPAPKLFRLVIEVEGPATMRGREAAALVQEALDMNPPRISIGGFNKHSGVDLVVKDVYDPPTAPPRKVR